VAVGLREHGMTLAKIAEAVGVSPQTVMRASQDVTFPDGKVEGADGKFRPAHYTPRELEEEADETDEDDERGWRTWMSVVLKTIV